MLHLPWTSTNGYLYHIRWFNLSHERIFIELRCIFPNPVVAWKNAGNEQNVRSSNKGFIIPLISNVLTSSFQNTSYTLIRTSHRFHKASAKDENNTNETIKELKSVTLQSSLLKEWNLNKGENKI